MSSPDTPAERAYVLAGVRQLDARFDQARDTMQAELDLYRSDASARSAELIQAHQDRVRQLEEAQRAWLDRFINGEPDEPAQDVGQGHADASAAGPAPAPGTGPGQPNHAAELTADDIKAMSMQDFAALRKQIGMANGSNGRGIFG